MSEEFTPGPWHLGIPFRHKDSMSEWCNLYADGESNHIAEILVFDGNRKNYYNAALIATAPDMRDCICDALSDLQMPEGMRRHFEEVLKQANGGKELPES